jgi:hypothetical protein
MGGRSVSGCFEFVIAAINVELLCEEVTSFVAALLRRLVVPRGSVTRILHTFVW